MKTFCPKCNALYEVEDSFAGQRVECPACQNKWIVGEGEKEEKYFRLETTPHLINEIFVLSISAALFLLGLLFFVVAIMSHNTFLFVPLVLIPIVVSLLLVAYAVLDNKHTKYTLEMDKITIRFGIITDNTRTIRISDIRDVIQEQGIFQKIFHAANLGFATAGTLGADFYLQDVKDYQLWKAKIEKLVEQRGGHGFHDPEFSLRG